MRARRVPVRRLSCLSAVLVGLVLAAAQPAAAAPMEHAWDICSGDNMAPQARLAQCTAIIESGKFKGEELAIALVNRGYARARLENLVGAIADFDEAEKHFPTLAFIPMNRGFAWLNSNDPERALADFTRALALQPDEAHIYWGRAMAHQRLNDSAHALADLSEALRLAPRALEARIARAELYLNADQRDSAIADYKVALAIDPGNKDIHAALRDRGIKLAEVSSTAACMAAQVAPQERVDACTALIESGNAEGRTLAYAYGNRGRALNLLKQSDRALDDLNEAIRIEPNYPIALNTRGQVHWLKRDPHAAIADFTRAIELEPASVWGYLQRAEMLLVVGAFDRAIADTTEAINRDPNVASAWFLRAQAYNKLKNTDAALTDCTRAIELAPKNVQYRAGRAYLHLNRKDYARALDDFSATIALEPSRDAYVARAWAYREAGEKDKAIADFQKALEIDPDFETARRALGYLDGKPPASAALPPGDCSNEVPAQKRIEACEAVIAGGTLTGWTLKTAHCNLGTLLTDAQQYDRAMEAAEQALKIGPQWACAYLNRGRAWYYKHDLDRAVADYNETLRLDPRFHEAYANRGTVHHDRKEFAAAIADYDAAIAIEAVPMYVSDRGNTRFQMGDYDRAIADQTRAIELDPHYVDAYLRRGSIFIEKQDYARAEADFAKALELAPDNPVATLVLNQAREMRAHPENAASRRPAKEMSFDHFRRMIDTAQPPQQ